MSDNGSSNDTLTYQQETAQDMLCLCAIVLVVGAILVIAYLQDSEKKLLKVVIGGVLITLGAVPCIVLCVCLQKMSDEAAEMNQYDTMNQFRAMQSINRLDGTMALRRFDGRMALSRLQSLEQNEIPCSDTDDSNDEPIHTVTQMLTATVPTITITLSPTEDIEEEDIEEVVSTAQLLPPAVEIQPRELLPPRRGSLFESVAEVMEAMSITR